MDNNDTKNDGATPGVVESTGSRFYALLVSWGVPGVIAAAVIGAVYAALVALGVLGQGGCSAIYDLNIPQAKPAELLNGQWSMVDGQF